jgi:hypothetical protein
MAGLFADDESAGAQRAMTAMLKMKKLDLAELQRAYDGKQGRGVREKRAEDRHDTRE